MNRSFYRLLCALILAGGVILTAGCVKQKTLVIVKPDGSGNIVLSRVFTSQGVAMISQTTQQMASEFGEAGVTVATNRFFNEKQIKREALQFGPHVKFVRAREVNRDGSRGFAAVYSFDSINDVQLPFDLRRVMMSVSMSMSDEMGDMMEMGGSPFGEMSDIAEFTFDAAAGTLNVSLPAFVADVHTVEPKPAPEPEAEDEFDEPDITMEGGMVMAAPGMMGASAEAMMEQAYSGLELLTELEVQGELAGTTASCPSPGHKGRYILYRIDFDALGKAMGGDPMSMGEDLFGGMNEHNPLAALNGYPGVVMETNRTVRFVLK